MHLAGPAQRHERHVLGHPGFEPNGGAGRDVEPVPVGGGPVELQRGVGLRQMDVAADLDRAVAGVDDSRAPAAAAPALMLDVAVAEDDLAWNHWSLLTGSGGGR